jgi:hypothetical protein
MKVRNFIFAVLLILLWSIAGPVAAADEPAGKTAKQEPAEEQTPPKPVAVVPQLKYEFEPVVDGKQVSHDFLVQNTGNMPLAIHQVKTG